MTYLEYKGRPGARHVGVMVEAERAYWNPQQPDHWVFENGFMRLFGEERAAAGAKSAAAYLYSGSFTSESLVLNKTPQQIVAEGKDPEEMSYQELRQYIANLRDQGASLKTLRELEVDLSNKLSIPFSSMVFALIGAPLGLRRLRGGAAVGLGVSILIIFCYYVLWHATSVLGESGQLSPALASWLANLVGLGVGGVLVTRAAS